MMTKNQSTVPVQLLNRLPLNNDPAQWCHAFQNALRFLLPDVDRITVHVNMQCAETVSSGRSLLTMVQHVSEVQARQYPMVLLATTDPESVFEELHDQFLRVHFPVHLFESPVALHYFYREQLAGYVVLWSSASSGPVSKRAIEMLSAMEHFILFALSDCIARNRWSPVAENDGMNVFQRYAEEWQLTEQDRRILMHLLSGASYKETADRLGVSINAIKKHAQKIYRTTSTNSLAELSAKYFMKQGGLVPARL